MVWRGAESKARKRSRGDANGLGFRPPLQQVGPEGGTVAKLRGYSLLFVIGAAALTIRALLDSDFRNSTLLYLIVPFAVSIALHLAVPLPELGPEEEPSVGRAYLRHLRSATIVMLATSALLFEGFICVLFFMPIYYAVVTVGFVFSWLATLPGGGGGGDRTGAFAIPALLLLLAMEGLFDETTVPRYGEATHVAILDGSIAELQGNMARPIAFADDRHWLLSIFPLPTRVEAGSLAAGDVHRLRFVYKRWFFTNIHEGDMAIRIEEVGKERIRTRIVENSSYLSNYLKIEGTEVRFRELGNGRTRVSLTVKYHRLLDPAWYFGPMQQLAAKESAKYLIESVIARKD
jgi:hypothetical protein